MLQLRRHLPELLQPWPQRRQEPRCSAAVYRLYHRKCPVISYQPDPQHFDHTDCRRWRPVRRGAGILHRGRDDWPLQACWIPWRDWPPPLDAVLSPRDAWNGLSKNEFKMWDMEKRCLLSNLATVDRAREGRLEIDNGGLDDNWEPQHHRHCAVVKAGMYFSIHGSTQKRESEGTARSIEVRIDGMNAQGREGLYAIWRRLLSTHCLLTRAEERKDEKWAEVFRLQLFTHPDEVQKAPTFLASLRSYLSLVPGGDNPQALFFCRFNVSIISH